MKLLDRYRARRRRLLGIDEILDEIESLRDMAIGISLQEAKEHGSLARSLGEVRGLLGLSADEIPSTREEIEGRDPHGL